MPGEGTALCNYLRENNIKLPKDVARSIVAYLALAELSKGDVETALDILRQAEKQGLLDDKLRSLLNRIDVLARLNNDIEETINIIGKLLGKASSENKVDTQLLAELGEAVNRLKTDIEKAKSLGIDVDTKPLLYAEDIYKIMNTIKEELPAVSETASLLQDFTGLLQQLQKASSVEEFTKTLEDMGSIEARAGKLLSKLQEGVKQLESLRLNTSEAKKIVDGLVSSLKTAETIARLVYTISSDSRILGIWLDTVNNWIKDAYRNPSNSPFGGARKLFVNKVADIVNLVHDMERAVAEVKPPEGAPDNIKQVLNGLKQVAHAIGTAVIITLENMKYYTTFNDYRWNGIWEEAESLAGVDWGNISKADVQKYEFDHCDETGCYTKKRSGLAGWLAEHMPEQVLSFWTTVEDALNSIEMYNKWTMNYAKNPILRALGHIGYMGSSIIMAVGSLLSPRLVSQQLHALYDLLKQWGSAIKSHNLSRIEEVGRETWNMFFGSKERALATIGALLLSTAVGSLIAKGLPKGAKVPLKRAILGQLAQGDIVGAGLVIMERMVPLARLRGVARALIEEGLVRASEIADDAGIISKVLEKAERASRVKALLNIDKLHDIIKRALRNAENYKQARANLEKVIREEGVKELAEEAVKYRTAKTYVLSNLKSLEVHAPTLMNRIRNLARRALGKEAPVEELPEALQNTIKEKAKVIELVRDEAGRVTAKISEQELKKLVSRRVISPEHLETLKLLDNIVERLEKAGEKRLAEAFKLVRDNYEKLAGEIERLKDIRETIEELSEAKWLGRAHELWKETVELSKRKKLPGKDWLRKEKVNIAEHMEKLREEVKAKLAEKEELARQLRKALKRRLNRLKLTGELSAERLLEELAEGLEEAGLGDLAEAVREAMKAETPASAKIGLAVSRLADKLSSKIEEWYSRIGEKISEASAENNPEFKASGLPRTLAKPFLAGLRLAEKIVDTLKRIGDELAKRGIKNAEEYEAEIVEKLAKTIEKEYSKVSLENLAILKGLKKGLEAYEHTPIGTLLTELDSAITKTLEAEERALEGELRGLELREKAREYLAELLGRKGRLEGVIVGLARKLGEIEKRMEATLREVPGAEAVIDRFTSIEGNPSEIVEEARRYATEHGLALPDDFWRAFKEYLEVRSALRAFEKLKNALDRGETTTLKEVQDAVNRLARIDFDTAWKADLQVIRGYLEEIGRELADLRNLAKKSGGGVLGDLEKQVEETLEAVRQVEERKPRAGGFSRLREITEIRKNYGQLAESLEQVYKVLEKGLGKEKVQGLRRLLDEFEAKLARGEFDEDLLKKMRWELRKIKLTSPLKGIRAELDRIRSRLEGLARRLIKGKEASMIEQAIEELADTIKEIEEKTVLGEKGWVGLNRIVEVAKAKFVRIPKEYAEKVARIFAEKTKTWTIKTRDGVQIRVKRTTEVLGDGTLHLRYELDFPGKRKIIYDELVKVGKDGKVRLIKDIKHDPEIARAVKAYEEVKKGLRKMDEEARLGEEVEDTLTRSLSEIDPDYDILSRLAYVSGDQLVPVISPLERAGMELLSQLVKTATTGALMGTALGGEALEEKIREIEESMPEAFWENLREAIERHASGLSTPRDEVLVSLTEPVVRRLSQLYPGLENADKVVSEGDRERLKRLLGVEIRKAGRLPKDYVEAPDIDLDKLNVFIILPEPDSSIVGFFENPERIIHVKIPGDGEASLPAVKIGNRLYIILPPFSIRLPRDLEKEFETSMEKQGVRQAQIQKQKAEYKQVQAPKPRGTTEEGGEGQIPAIPPIIPAIPWGGKEEEARKYKQRERLNI